MSNPYDIFDAVAADYDSVGVDYVGPMGAALAAAAGIGPGDRVLDVGCGRGAVLLPAAERVGTTGHVTGIDMAPAMVELTRAATADAAQVTVQVGDGQAPDFPDGSFDVVTAGLLLFFLPDPGAALRAYHRLLVPGGKLAVSTFAAHDPRFRAAMGLVREHAVDPPPQPPHSVTFEDAGRLREAMAEAGFTGTTIEDFTVRSDFRDLDHFLTWVGSHAGQAVLGRVPAQRRPDLLVALEKVFPDRPDLITTAHLVVAVRPAA